MTRDLVMVGTGDYWRGLVKPSLSALQKTGLVNRISTVDIAEQEAVDGMTHVVRKADQPLSELVDGMGYQEPFVILAHPNQLHVPDALDLIDNSASKPKLLIEKPYAITEEQMGSLAEMLHQNEGSVGFLEYYLFMKSVPLLLSAGVVKQNSFYFEDNGILRVLKGNSLADYFGKLSEVIGQPLFVVSDVLEGEGSYGTVEHRDISLVDKRKGGGMVQDLGHHAVSPLLALENIIGRINADSIKDVRVAWCDEYMENARRRGLKEENIGESYAEVDIETQSGIPLKIRLGKYIEGGLNQRRIIIAGTKGVVLYDMTNNILAFQHRDEVNKTSPLVQAEKKAVPKYLAVLMAGMESLEGRNPFTFNPIDVAFRAQKFAFDVLNKPASSKATYKQGAMHDTLFR